jgi:DNA-binding GntR family transcriptional regulator
VEGVVALTADHSTIGTRDNERLVRPRRPPVDVASILRPTDASRLADDVGSRLRESILKGLFVAGDRLREEELAHAMGVSRGPIRDALAQLDREGLVVRRRNRGAIVAELFRGDLDEVFSLRLAIEPVATAWAARHATGDDVREMHRIVNGYSKLNTRVSDRQAAEVDLAFHDVVYRSSAHGRALALWWDLRAQVCVFLIARAHVRTSSFRRDMLGNHSAILAAIETGDEISARELAVEHVQQSYLKLSAADQDPSTL